MMINRRILFAGAAGLALAGCSDLVGPLPPSSLYVLKPRLPGAIAGPAVSWALSIPLPAAAGGFDSDRIAILKPPAGFDYYASSAWADPLPLLVQSVLLEAFEGSGRIASVARESDAAQSDYLLGVDIRDFEARYDAGEGAPLAVVRLGVRLVSTHTRKIAGYTELSKEVRASSNAIGAAVDAMNTAFSGVLANLVPWVLNRPAPV